MLDTAKPYNIGPDKRLGQQDRPCAAEHHHNEYAI